MADHGYRDLAQFIIDNVGGKSNIVSVVHCTTRLRFKLKDEAKANDDALKANDGVVTVVKAGGQYQVVIGTHVDKVYDDVLAVGGLSGGGQVADDYEDKENMSLVDRFIDLISGIFTPFLGVMAAAGMIQGLTSAMGSFGWISQNSGTYNILYGTGNAFFYFLPLVLGITAARKFNVNEFVGMAIGGAMVYPKILALYNSKTILMTLFKGSVLASPIHATFLKIPVILMDYSSTVIPIILAIWFASYVQKLMMKLIPGVVQLFLVPFGVLLITVPVTFLVIGPVATWAADLIAAIIQAVINFSPVVAALLVGGFWQILVMFGVHWGIVAAFYTELSTQGWDQMLLFSVAVCFSQIGVVTAIIFQTKNPKTKAIAVPALISGIFGVTEPAIYGVTLPRKRSFILSCLGGAIGAVPFALGGVKAFSMAGMGVFAFPMVIGKTNVTSSLIWWLAAVIVSYVAGLLLQLLFGKSAVDTPEELAKLQADAVTEVGAQAANVKEQAVKQQVQAAMAADKAATQLNAPVNGQVVPLAEVKDEVFSSGAMGQGIANLPSDGILRAPADGKIALVFPTGHAVGMNTDAGAEVLMHIGMDTVNLEGRGFETLVEKDQVVKAGDPLVKFDLQVIKEAGYETTTIMVITNSNQYHEITPVAQGNVTTTDTVLTLD